MLHDQSEPLIWNSRQNARAALKSALLQQEGDHAVQRLFGASDVAWQDTAADLRGSARAGRQRRSPGLLDVLHYRALLFPKIRRLAEPVRILREMLGAHEADQVPHAGAC